MRLTEWKVVNEHIAVFMRSYEKKEKGNFSFSSKLTVNKTKEAREFLFF